MINVKVRSFKFRMAEYNLNSGFVLDLIDRVYGTHVAR